MIVAGRPVAEPLIEIGRYLRKHHDTVAHFDLLSPEERRVSRKVIQATRSPWMGSRISEEQADWFLERAVSAPFDKVALDASLRDADPTRGGGPFDSALTLWSHFLDDSPAGVSVGKISKVLHVTRPGLFPILDSRLRAAYHEQAKTAAQQAAEFRPALRRYRLLFWEAVRQDILLNEEALRDLRRALRADSAPHAARVAGEVSDLRLLDMLTWKQ